MDASQLKQVEALCETLYTGVPTKMGDTTITRQEAQQRLLSLQSSPEFIPQCQYILDTSQSHYARLVASNSLIELVTVHWNNYTVPQRVDIRNYVLHYLGVQGPTLPDFLTLSLVKLVCRITKLGWFDDPAHREMVDEVTKFLSATIGHCILGLKILNLLVDELNIPSSGRTLTQHRKTSVSFRDVALLKVFQLGLTTLKQLQSGAIGKLQLRWLRLRLLSFISIPQLSFALLRTIANADNRQQAELGLQSLSLVVRCLNFDFIGTNSDESTEDVGTIQAPTAWRGLIADPATMDLLLEFYAKTEPPQSAKAMEALILISSVRRSLFPTDKERAAFLSRLIDGIRKLLLNRTGLNHQDNYHEFCRLLGRLKANYQLNELVKTEGYLEWLELAANFTQQSLENWQYSTNSIHYLLALWARLVAAMPYVRAEAGTRSHADHLKTQVLSVVQIYITSMLQSVPTVLQNGLDDPLEDDGSLKEQLDRLPVICRFEYSAVATMILDKFDPLMTQYRNAVTTLGTSATSAAPETVQQNVAIIEGQLTWLVYIVGAVVGGHSWSTAQTDGNETIDASLSRRVLQLAQGMDYRLTSSQGQGRADRKLEEALLFYFQNFRRVYMFMWDQMSGNGNSNATENIVSMMTSKLDHAAAGPSTKQQIYLRMFDHLGMGDHSEVSNLIITKMGNNLKYWPEDDELIGKTLELLHDMAQGYSSSKMLLTLDTVRYLTSHHTEEHFSFLLTSNPKHRTTFHATLTRLLLSPGGEEKLAMTLEQFLEPVITKMTQLNAMSSADLRQEHCRMPLIGVLRDLRGITSSLHNRKTYGQLFDILHPHHLPLLSKIADVWADQNDVAISLLRFLHEFCSNKANRVNFDQSSPNGILLFRCTSDVVCAFGRRLLAMPPLSPNDPELYKKRYKGLSLALNILNSSLGGNYVCFGVFDLYQDRALDNALDVALRLALSVPGDDIQSYVKLSKAYFSFLEILFRNHRNAIFSLETSVFMQIMTAIHDGLQASDATISAFCANSIDHLATFYFSNAQKDRPEVRSLNKVRW
jgi:exportin-7